MSESRRTLRMLALMLFTLLAWLQYRLWFGEGGAWATAALQSRVDRQAVENGGLRQRNELLVAEVENLKSGESAAEERARSELGMIKPGEVFYRVVEQQMPVALEDDADGHAEGHAGGAANATAAAQHAVDPSIDTAPQAAPQAIDRPQTP